MSAPLDLQLGVLHSLTFINIPIAIMSIYCIHRGSPKAMQGMYKRLLLAHAILVACSDLCMTVLTCPVLLAPVIGFYMEGFLDWLGVPTLIQFAITISCIMVSAVSVDILIHFRFDSILPGNSWMKIPLSSKRVFYYSLMFFFAIVPSYVLVLMFPPELEQLHLKLMLIKKYPDLMEELLDSRTVATSFEDSRYAFITYIITIIALIGVLSIVGFFIGYSFCSLLKATSFMSETTKKQSLHFLTALIFQSLVHFSLLVVPLVIVCVFQMRFDYQNRTLTNASVCIFSLHGSAGLLTMILVTKPYRKFCLNAIRCCSSSPPNILQVTPSQTPFTVSN